MAIKQSPPATEDPHGEFIFVHHFTYEIATRTWATRRERAQTVKELLGYAAQGRIPYDVAMPLVRYAIEERNEEGETKYKESFYLHQYNFSLKKTQLEKQKKRQQLLASITPTKSI